MQGTEFLIFSDEQDGDFSYPQAMIIGSYHDFGIPEPVMIFHFIDNGKDLFPVEKFKARLGITK